MATEMLNNWEDVTHTHTHTHTHTNTHTHSAVSVGLKERRAYLSAHPSPVHPVEPAGALTPHRGRGRGTLPSRPHEML